MAQGVDDHTPKLHRLARAGSRTQQDRVVAAQSRERTRQGQNRLRGSVVVGGCRLSVMPRTDGWLRGAEIDRVGHLSRGRRW